MLAYLILLIVKSHAWSPIKVPTSANDFLPIYYCLTFFLTIFRNTYSQKTCGSPFMDDPYHKKNMRLFIKKIKCVFFFSKPTRSRHFRHLLKTLISIN